MTAGRPSGPAWALGVLVLGALLLAGCLHAPVATPSKSAMPVAVGYAFDHEYDRVEEAVPAELEKHVGEALVTRNLPPRTLGFSQVMTDFSVIRDTPHRLARVAELDRAAPILLLVETKARFLAASEGRYSWKVYVRLTAARRGALAQPLSNDFELPSVLQFDHEHEAEAVAAVSGVIADRVGSLLDALLQLPASEAPTALRPRVPSPHLEPGTDAIYFVLVDRFANGDKTNDQDANLKDPAAFHGGDLAGVLQHVEDLRALGVKTVWLSPIFKSRTAKFFGHGAFHGYWVEDLRELEPRFGTPEQLRELAEALHARGMRLVLDMVLNHVAFDAPMVQENPTWFHHQGDIKDWNDPVQVQNGNVMGLPDLAQENPEVEKYLVDSSLHWVDFAQVDGFRLDAVRHVPLSFWASYNDQVHAHAGAGFYLLGELLDGNPATLARAQRDGKFDALFDFPLHYALMDVFCGGKDPAKLAAILSLDRTYPDANSLVTLLDNHDLPRAATACKGDLERVRRALTFQLTTRGTPSLSYGTELGMTGDKEPANRGDMRFDARAPLRDTISALLRLREGHASLQTGATDLVGVEPGLFAYARVTPSEAAFIVINSRSRAAPVAVPSALVNAHLTEAFSGRPVSPDSVVVPPESVLVLFAEPKEREGFAAWAARAQQQSRTGARTRVVDFVARGPTSADEGVFVVGSGPELGNWDPAHALGPVSAEGLRRALPLNEVHEYKLLVRRKGRAPEWEPGENHVLWVREGQGTQRVETTWGRTAS